MSIKLWTPRIRDLSRDILHLMGSVVDPARTYFFASTMNGRFSVLGLENHDGVSVEEHASMPLEQSYCGLIHNNNLPFLVIPDSRTDPRTAGLAVTWDANVGSYLGVPVRLPDQSMFGTLCAVDPESIHYSETQRDNIRILAHIMERALESEYLARRDALSGVFNRLYWDELRVDNHDRDAQVLLFDIDDFKSINDTNGHDAGNWAIKQFGGVLRDSFPQGETIRLGGDEFCVVMPKGKAVDLARDYSRFLENLRALDAFPTTVSCGVSSMGHNLSDLLREADAAMYEAKRRGF